MNDIFLHPITALVVSICVYLGWAYSSVMGVWTMAKLDSTRHVARAVSLMIAAVGVMAIAAELSSSVRGCETGPVQLSQVVQVMNIMISVLVLKLFLRPCYVEQGVNCEAPRHCRELT